MPESLITQHPPTARQDSRLLVCDPLASDQASCLLDRKFTDFLDLLVMNNTRVIPARLLGQKASGGKAEVLIERLVTDHEALAHVRASKSPKSGTALLLKSVVKAEVTGPDPVSCSQYNVTENGAREHMRQCLSPFNCVIFTLLFARFRL